MTFKETTVAETPADAPVSRALVVREPWASLLVSGYKTWELRKAATRVRGRIAVASGGSTSLVGEVTLTDCLGPFSASELNRRPHLHRCSSEEVAAYAGDGQLYAWVVDHPLRYPEPVSYDHPPGAVIWVRLDS